ncbi:MAG: DUF3592 domain-containing protein [Akkermansia sp.]|nr:DUF3592 domain-containing protein [Akkermansia sp.]
MLYNDDYKLQVGCGFIIALCIFFFVGRGLFGYASQIYEERKLLETPITGTIVYYKLHHNYPNSIKDIIVEFEYKGKKYTLDSQERDQVVFTSYKLHHSSGNFSTINVYVNPEEPQKSRVERRFAGWGALLVVSIASFMWLGSLLFLVIKFIKA